PSPQAVLFPLANRYAPYPLANRRALPRSSSPNATASKNDADASLSPHHDAVTVVLRKLTARDEERSRNRKHPRTRKNHRTREIHRGRDTRRAEGKPQKARNERWR